MKEYIVTEAYESSNPDPIVLVRGDTVRLGERSNSNGPWANWIYCTGDRTGKRGWTPLQLLDITGDTAVANADYDAREMTVAVGDIVCGDIILNGWLWATRSADRKQAWVPLNCIKERTPEMNVLVFGGTRFMGVHLVRELISKGYAVTVASRGLTADGFGDAVTRVTVDRTDAEAIREKLGAAYYDIVFDSLCYCSNDARALLGSVRCGKYIEISSASVYPNLGMDTGEDDYNPAAHPLRWCSREDDTYDEIKRQAEAATVQAFADIPATMVRFPYVIGMDDYTKRLYFYVEHLVKQQPMLIDNLHQQIAFVRSDEAGRFLAWLGDRPACGPINGASSGTVTVARILDYLHTTTGKAAILSPDGDAAPYNGDAGFSLATQKADTLGFHFSPLRSWLWELLDEMVKVAEEQSV